MLAQNVGDYSRIKDNDWPLYVQPKLDGFRAIAHINSSGEIEILSNRGLEYNHLDIIKKQLKKMKFKT